MFDDCKEDLLPQSFPCECGGEISEYEDGTWSCDTCDFEKKNETYVSEDKLRYFTK